MKSSEIALRKELAIAHLRIARTEMALARVQKQDSLAVASCAVDLASSVLAQRRYGAWSQYARIALGVAHVVLGVYRPPALPRRGEAVRLVPSP